MTIWLDEAATEALRDFLLSIGWSSPYDGIEAIYTTLLDGVTIIWRLFA